MNLKKLQLLWLLENLYQNMIVICYFMPLNIEQLWVSWNISLIRQEISYTMNELCQFFHYPTNVHWIVVKRLLCYLKRTSHYGMLLSKSNTMNLMAHIDVNWASKLMADIPQVATTSIWAILLFHKLSETKSGFQKFNKSKISILNSSSG